MIHSQQTMPATRQLQVREAATWMLLVTFLLLFIAGIFVILKIAYPRPIVKLIGTIDEFPPSDTPYTVMLPNGGSGSDWIYLVNTGEELLALEPLAPYPPGPCLIKWEYSNQRFADPCKGSKFSLRGGYFEGPAHGNMDRYALTVDASGALFIDKTAPIQQSKADVLERCQSAADQFHHPGNPHLSCQELWQAYQRRIEPIQQK